MLSVPNVEFPGYLAPGASSSSWVSNKDSMKATHILRVCVCVCIIY